MARTICFRSVRPGPDAHARPAHEVLAGGIAFMVLLEAEKLLLRRWGLLKETA